MNPMFIQPPNRKSPWIVKCEPFKGSVFENTIRVVQLELRSGHIHIIGVTYNYNLQIYWGASAGLPRLVSVNCYTTGVLEASRY